MIEQCWQDGYLTAAAVIGERWLLGSGWAKDKRVVEGGHLYAAVGFHDLHNM